MNEQNNIIEKTKICCRCKVEQNVKHFNKDSKSKDKLKASCKICISNYNKVYTIKNQIKFRKQAKKWKKENEERVALYIKYYQNKNKAKIYQKSTEYHRNRYNNDYIFKLRRLLRDRIYKVIYNKNVTFKTKELLQCSFEFLKQHLESQFLPEMNWGNHGTVWEIDHIIPCSKFNLTDPEQQKQCFHYSNLQPLFKTTQIAESFGYVDQIGNRNKSNKTK